MEAVVVVFPMQLSMLDSTRLVVVYVTFVSPKHKHGIEENSATTSDVRGAIFMSAQ